VSEPLPVGLLLSHLVGDYLLQTHHQATEKTRAWGPEVAHTATGYPADTPAWLAVWLLIVADNTCHLLINAAAVSWAQRRGGAP
jgi:lysine/ornithine N-monooxygenase